MGKLTIQRSRWARTMADGTRPNGDSYLLNDKGAMCCMGFDCLDLGESPLLLKNTTFPFYKDLRTTFPDFNQQDDVACINDRSKLGEATFTDEEQERFIAELFAQHGREVEFVD